MDARTPRDAWRPWLQGLAIACALFCLVSVALTATRLHKPFAGFRATPVLTVSGTNVRGWPGLVAGLRPGDRLLTLDGAVLRRPADLTAALRAAPPGAPLHYQVLRGQQRLAIKVAASQLTPGMWVRGFGPLMLVGLLHLLIGMSVYWRRPDHPASGALLGLTLAIALWAFLGNEYDATHRLAWAYVLVLPLPAAAALHLAAVFPERRRWWRPWLPPLLYGPTLLAAYAWTLLGRSEGPLANAIAVERQSTLFGYVTAWHLLAFAVLLGSLGLRAWSQPPRLRAQARLALTAAGLGYLPIVGLALLPPGLPAPAWGLELALTLGTLFPLALAIAIVRPRIFDLEQVLRRIVLTASLAVALSGVYALSLMAARNALGWLGSPSAHPVGPYLGAVAAALALLPLRDRLQAGIDRLWFRPRYDPEQIVRGFADAAQQSSDSQGLVRQFIQVLEATLGPSYVAVYGRVGERAELRLLDAVGQDLALPRHLAPDHPGEAGQLATLSLPLIANHETIGQVLLGPRRSELDYTPPDHQLLERLIQALAANLRHAQRYEQLAQRAGSLERLVKLFEEASVASMNDGLTRLKNRRAFSQIGTTLLSHAQRYEAPLSVLVLDVDHFRRFNDTYSHALGDLVLGTVADVLRASLREADTPARWGGEEFAVLMPETGREGACLVAERIRAALEAHPRQDAAGRPLAPITASFGVATATGGMETLDTLMSRAEAALLLAKHLGRNCVCTELDVAVVHAAESM